MAETRYTVRQSSLDNVGYEDYSPEDRSVVESFAINSSFDEASHNIELHIYGLDGTLLDSNLNYRGAQQLQGAENGANLSIDPERDALEAGYDQGSIKLLYNFLNNLSPQEFFIQEISADRTELKVLPVNPTFDATETVELIQELINTGAYYSEFRLNFGGNDLLIGVNIENKNTVLVKLYEPLPSQYSTKSKFTFDEIISDSVVFEVEAEYIPETPTFPTLRGANFNLDSGEEHVQPTEYFDYNELYSYDVTSSLHGVITQLSSSGVQLSINHTEYENFIHFGSAEERVRNFNYKMGLLESYDYSASISTTYQPHYDNLTKGVISKFDEYEKYLYFESGAKAWPKTNANSPYINDTVSNSTSWFNEQVASASLYDELNESRLTYTVPEFIREDASNEPYTLFLDMIGQHFDNLWVYTRAMTDKYDADNRIDIGVSRDLIRDVLKSFGVKLYSSNFSVSNLAASFIGEFYQSGSETINSFVTASNDPTPDKDILSETYKRIYHNLPYLVKTKGTERGLRALINCFGIPSGSLEITETGGYTKDDYFFNRAESIDKIRLDNTGSLVTGDTLSQHTSIQNIDDKYTQDSHQVDISFSPTKYLNTHIENNITGSYPSGFNIDEYIGDITLQSSSSYKDLNSIAETALSGSDRYDTFDFVRLIKFFDNQLFKMIKDYVPARAVTTTGITVKPHILNRSKISTPVPTWSRPEYSGSIDTAFIQGGEGGTVTSSLDTTHTITISTKSGSIEKTIDNNSPEFNGELGGTVLTVATQSLNIANTFKTNNHPVIEYNTTRTTVAPSGEIGGSDDPYPGTAIANGAFNFRYRQIGELPDPVTYNLIDAKIRKISANGVDIEGAVGKLKKVHIQNRVLEVEYIGEYDTHYYLKIKQQDDVTRISPTSGVDTILDKYVDPTFKGSEYEALINNAIENRTSANFLQSDRFTGINPDNLDSILTTSASKATVQDSNYESNAYSNIRYNGVEHQASAFNAVDSNTELVPVDDTHTYFAYFNWIGGTSPDLPRMSQASVKYIIDLDGNIISPRGNDSEALEIVKQTFVQGEEAIVVLDNPTASGNNMSSLNGTQTIHKGGQRVENLISTLSSSYATAVTGSKFWFEDLEDGSAVSIQGSPPNGNFTQGTSGTVGITGSFSSDILNTPHRYLGMSGSGIEGTTPVSTDSTQKYLAASDGGYSRPSLPFTISRGDVITFLHSTSNTYFDFLILNVDSGSSATQVRLELDKPITLSAYEGKGYSIRRYVDAAGAIILDTNKPPGGTSGGILQPKHLPQGAEKKMQTIIKDLKEKGII